MIRRRLLIMVSGVACLSAVAGHAQTSPATNDPLARAMTEAASAFAAETKTDPLWADAKTGIESSLNDAQRALAAGRRWFALERLAQARQSFFATRFAVGHPAERADLAAFEREWTRLGATLGNAAPAPLDTMRPAALRALAEAAMPQVRINYDAALEYGRNTQPEYGLYYVGVADAQQQFVTLARTLSRPAPDGRTAPQLRSIAGEIAALQHELLTLYRPPASTERHSEFIVASSALKEARQYDASALRHAALLRYLQAAQRTAMLRAAGGPDAAIADRVKELRTRLEGGGVDHSIGLLMLERAEAGLDLNTAVGRQTAEAIVIDALPRYFAALEPAAPAAATPPGTVTPVVTVTLVRWPFT